MVVGQPEEHQCWGLGQGLSFPDLPIPLLQRQGSFSEWAPGS